MSISSKDDNRLSICCPAVPPPYHLMARGIIAERGQYHPHPDASISHHRTLPHRDIHHHLANRHTRHGSHPTLAAPD
ncbi:hypothetical protein EJ04DRAFT_173047 [Polyplosphaeria fusca]|uniref:Uncharacterized protein n=1 Tax=Polyplosphaeria fusca TaxID=682080 RepID=A0A9P4R3X0_9PLEO|nr:hypothetical protein EJ04DRAFT_173047 [Polyplosphaeria fusca]